MTPYPALVKVALLGRGRQAPPPDDGPFGGLDLEPSGLLQADLLLYHLA